MARQQQKTNWFAIWVTIGVVVALAAVVALVVWMNNAATAPAPRPDSAGINQETGAVVVGEGSNEVDVYFDFFCPHCQDFEDANGEAITNGITDGSITLNLHPVALPGLNAASGTEFSERASNAMYCVADAEPTAAYPFFQAVFGQHPTGSGLSDEQLISYAVTAGAPGTVADCFADRTWSDLVAEQTKNLPADPETGSTGTPVLLVNGEWVPVTLNPAADITERLK